MEPWRKELYLKHFGIKGQHWGVRRGPPYPIGKAVKAGPQDSSGTKKAAANQDVSHFIRNVAVSTVIGAAAVGAAYYASKHDLFSKIRISDLKNGTRAMSGKIKFSSEKMTFDDHSAHIAATPLIFQAARNRYRDRLKELDKIIYPSGEKSLLDVNSSFVEMGNAVLKGIDERMRQGNAALDIVEFARVLSEGKVNPDIGALYSKNIILIDDNRALFEQAIKSGKDFGDLKAKEAEEVLKIIEAMADIYRDDRPFE